MISHTIGLHTKISAPITANFRPRAVMILSLFKANALAGKRLNNPDKGVAERRRAVKQTV